MSKFKTPKIKRHSWYVHKIVGAHLQCANITVRTIIMQNLIIKEEKLLELHITQTRHPLSISGEKNVLVQHPSKLRKYLSNVQIWGAKFQCMNTHYVKFEYKGMNTVQATDYTNYALPQTCCGWTDRRTGRLTNGWSGPTTRPVFTKVTQVITFENMCHKDLYTNL